MPIKKLTHLVGRAFLNEQYGQSFDMNPVAVSFRNLNLVTYGAWKDAYSKSFEPHL